MIVIINYGLGNLLSIKRAVDLYTDGAVITDNPDTVQSADKIILPGVGAFHYGMDCLNRLRLTEVIVDKVKRGTPLLGICLGMQLLFDESDEGGVHEGLGLIPGRVEKIPDKNLAKERQNVPHIGWERLFFRDTAGVSYGILKDIPCESEFYFVHSYEGKPACLQNDIASTHYGGRNLCAVVQSENVVGCQFHPEKSGRFGLEIIKNYVIDF